MPTIPRLKDKSTKKEPKQSKKYYDSKQWKSLRNNYYRLHPLCEMCLEEGITTPAEHIHHKVEFLKGITEEQRWYLLLDPNNLQSLCTKHHYEVHNSRKFKQI